MVIRFITLTLTLALGVLQTSLQAHADEPALAELIVIETDAIEPVEILHKVEEFIVDDHLEQRYNYYIYNFEKYDAYLHARAYFDDSGSVSIYGPFSDNKHLNKTESPKLYNEVLAYLKRRFWKIDALGSNGYITVWEQTELD